MKKLRYLSAVLFLVVLSINGLAHAEASLTFKETSPNIVKQLVEGQSGDLTYEVTLNDSASAAGDEYTYSIATDNQCILFTLDSAQNRSSKLYQNGTVTLTGSNPFKLTSFYVTQLDDKIYEGDHTCRVTYQAKSNNFDVQSSVTIPVKDNDSESTTSTTQSTTTATPAVTTGELKIDSLKINGKAYRDGDDWPEVTEGKGIKLSGKTRPQAKVTLYVQTVNEKYSAIADDKGAWSYTVTGLKTGTYRFEADVTDLTSNETSEKNEIALVKVKAASKKTAASTATADKKDGPNLLVIVAAIILPILIIGAVVFYLYKKKLGPFKKKRYSI